jgi:hypothetical protein
MTLRSLRLFLSAKWPLLLSSPPIRAIVLCMEAVRCLECGATRWALTPVTLEHMLAEPCEVCGGETAVERRRPGSRHRLPFVERRDTPVRAPA